MHTETPLQKHAEHEYGPSQASELGPGRQGVGGGTLGLVQYRRDVGVGQWEQLAGVRSKAVHCL